MNANFHGLAFKPNVMFGIENDLEIEWVIRLHHIWGPVCNRFLENGNGAPLINVFLAQLVRTNLIIFSVSFSESSASGSSNQSCGESPLGSAIVL